MASLAGRALLLGVMGWLSLACSGSSNTGYLPEGGLDGAAGATTGGTSGGGSGGTAATGGASGTGGAGGAAGAAGTAGGTGGAAGSSGTGGATGGTGGGTGGSAGTGGMGATGGTGAGGSGGNGGGGPCVNSLDCVGTATPVCNASLGTCVECVGPPDCTGTADCVGGRCVPYVPCVNSLGCAGTATPVCDAAGGRCVECNIDADCSAGVCESKVCVVRTACQSDTQCTPLGQLCDVGLGYCVDCVADRDCQASQHCLSGSCAADVCTGGSSSCQGNALVSCAANGSGWQSSMPCGSRQTCTTLGTTASCTPWVCTAGATECQGNSVVTCSADGLTVLSSSSCGGQACSGGQCVAQVCSPSTYFCSGQTVMQCNSTGTGSTVSAQCSSSCVSGQCTACVPSTRYCQGSLVYQCDAFGNPGTPVVDCANSGQVCAGGTCSSSCNATVRDLRLAEVFLGTGDYVILENRGACPVNLSGAQLRTSWRNNGETVNSEWVVTLPSQVLAAGARVRISDEVGISAPDIYAGGNIGYAASAVGAAELCQGPCGTLANTIDVLVFDASTTNDYTGLPAGAAFVTPMGSITSLETHAYRRTAWAGASPTWRSSDWGIQPASYPFTTAGCPATEPANGSTCTTSGQICTYGLTTCECTTVFLFEQWTCTP